jgi:hypothetical protein
MYYHALERHEDTKNPHDCRAINQLNSAPPEASNRHVDLFSLPPVVHNDGAEDDRAKQTSTSLIDTFAMVKQKNKHGRSRHSAIPPEIRYDE